jgi:flagellar hook-basal body complex protein FliE
MSAAVAIEVEEMAMNIGGLPGALGGLGAAGAPAVGPQRGQDAGDAFGGLLASLTGAQQSAENAMVDVATGSDGDMHNAVLAVEMESLQFDLAVQIRNRLVDAYQEMFRMSV